MKKKNLYSSEALKVISRTVSNFFKRGDLIALFAAAIIIRIILLAASNNQIGTSGVLDRCFDCRLYLMAAEAFSRGAPVPENALFYFGPGYVYFLGLIIKIIGYYPLLIILTNILISGLGCIFIYNLARLLTRSYPIAIVSGLLACFSYTSITLSCMTMSDTFFFTLVAAALTVFIKALENGRWSYFIAAGLLLGYSVLTRSVGQFWPIMVIIIALIYFWLDTGDGSAKNQKFAKFGTRILVTVLIILVLAGSWIIRNKRVNDVYALAISGANGPANVAAITIEKITGKYSKETLDEWVDGKLFGQGQYGEIYREYRQHAAEVFDTLGAEMIKTYFSVVWDNLNEFNYQHRILVPDYDHFMIPLEHRIKDGWLKFLPLILVIWGCASLIIQRQFRTAAILAAIFIYFILMTGAFRWQGARYSYPAYIAGCIFIASGITFFLKIIKDFFKNFLIR